MYSCFESSFFYVYFSILLSLLSVHFLSIYPNHQSQKYDLEDKIIKYYPQEIQKTLERIEGLSKDHHFAQEHPLEHDNFSMSINGKTYTEKQDAGEAIIALCSTIKNVQDRIDVGEFRGFPMTLNFEDGKFRISMKRSITHIAELEDSTIGNITRINNALENIPKAISNLTTHLNNLKNQQESAQAEVDTPFPREKEDQGKVERLAKLNIELDNSENTVEQSTPSDTQSVEKPSILNALKINTAALKSKKELPDTSTKQDKKR